MPSPPEMISECKNSIACWKMRAKFLSLGCWYRSCTLQDFLLDAKAIGASVPRLPSGIVVGGLVWRFLGAGAGALGAGLRHLHSSHITNCFPLTARSLFEKSSSIFLIATTDNFPIREYLDRLGKVQLVRNLLTALSRLDHAIFFVIAMDCPRVLFLGFGIKDYSSLNWRRSRGLRFGGRR